MQQINLKSKMNMKINLYWYKHNKGRGNFGDELNPYIISKLTGQEINHVEVNYLFDDKLLAVKTLIKALIGKKIRIRDFIVYLYFNFIHTPAVLLVIGSILESSYSSKNIIWGAGFINSATSKVKGKFLAIRGYKTKDKLQQMNISPPHAFGDPALLLPLIYQPTEKKNNKIGIIPHYHHFHSFNEKFGDEYLIIDLLEDIEKVIEDINSCKFTLSTSLHGIIVSHCYAVPSIWSEFPQLTSHKLAGDNIKFYDYFSSVNISDYEPFIFDNIEDFQESSVFELLDKKGQNIFLPSKDLIEKIQHNLLSVAPFKILDKILVQQSQPTKN